MQETGIVKELHGNDALLVFYTNSSKCQKCGACSGAKNGGEKSRLVQNTLHAEVGDAVTVKTPQRSFFEATVLLYLLPLLALIAGILIGSSMGLSDLAILIIGLGCACAIYLAYRLLDPWIRRSGRFSPVMLRIHGKENEQAKDESSTCGV